MEPKTSNSGNGNKNSGVSIASENPIENLGDRIASLTNKEAEELKQYLDYFFDGWRDILK
jgi:hypothetical protein